MYYSYSSHSSTRLKLLPNEMLKNIVHHCLLFPSHGTSDPLYLVPLFIKVVSPLTIRIYTYFNVYYHLPLADCDLWKGRAFLFCSQVSLSLWQVLNDGAWYTRDWLNQSLAEEQCIPHDWPHPVAPSSPGSALEVSSIQKQKEIAFRLGHTGRMRKAGEMGHPVNGN